MVFVLDVSALLSNLAHLESVQQSIVAQAITFLLSLTPVWLFPFIVLISVLLCRNVKDVQTDTSSTAAVNAIDLLTPKIVKFSALPATNATNVKLVMYLL